MTHNPANKGHTNRILIRKTVSIENIQQKLMIRHTSTSTWEKLKRDKFSTHSLLIIFEHKKFFS